MDAKLKALYHKVILKHDKNPLHYEKRPAADHVIEAYNPLCGDRFQVFLEIENGIIRHAHFHGYGCAISKASTSVLVKNLVGKTREEVKDLIENFQAVVKSDASVQPWDEEFEAFAAAQQFPGRLPCVTLSWTNVEDFLKSL